MAIIDCPECTGKVSTTAAACPHCGAPVSKLVGSPVAVPSAFPILPDKATISSRSPEVVMAGFDELIRPFGILDKKLNRQCQVLQVGWWAILVIGLYLLYGHILGLLFFVVVWSSKKKREPDPTHLFLPAAFSASLILAYCCVLWYLNWRLSNSREGLISVWTDALAAFDSRFPTSSEREIVYRDLERRNGIPHCYIKIYMQLEREIKWHAK